MKYLNNKGFGLPEVIIASVIGTLTFFTMTKMVLSSMKGSRHVQSKSDFGSIVDEVRLILNDANSCPLSLLNANFPPTRAQFSPDANLNAIDQFSSIQIAQGISILAGQSYSTFKITSLTLSEADRNLRKVLSPTQTKYLAKLTVTAQKTGSWMGTDILSHDFFTWLVVSTAADSTANQILGCSPYGIAPQGGSTAQVLYFDAGGPYKVKLSAGTYYITAIGGGGGAGGAQAGGDTADGGGGAGGGFAFSKCTFDGPVVLDFTVGKGGAGNHWGAGGLEGGDTVVSLAGIPQVAAEGGHGGTPAYGTPIASQNGAGGQGKSISTANCSTIATLSGGNGGTRAGISGAGGGGAGNAGVGGLKAKSALGGNGGNGESSTDSLIDSYSLKGGAGGMGGCDSSYTKGEPYQAGIEGASPGGGGGASCNGHRGSNGAPGKGMIYPE